MAKAKVLMKLNSIAPEYRIHLEKQEGLGRILIATDHYGNHKYYPIPLLADECRVFLLLLNQWYEDVDGGIKECERYLKEPPTLMPDVIEKWPLYMQDAIKETLSRYERTYKRHQEELLFLKQVKIALVNQDAVLARALLVKRGSQDSEEFKIDYMQEVPQDYEIT